MRGNRKKTEAGASARFDVRIFDASSLAVAVLRLELDEAGTPVDFEYQYVNDALASLRGMDRSEMTGRGCRELFGSVPKWISQYGRAALEGESVQFRAYASVPDSFLQISCAPAGKGCCTCVVNDFTEVIHTVQRGVESADILMLYYDGEQDVFTLPAAVCRKYGFPAARMTLNEILALDLLTNESRNLLRRNMRSFRKDFRPFTIVIRFCGGQIVRFSMSHPDASECLSDLGYFDDITEEYYAKEETRTGMEVLRSLSEDYYAVYILNYRKNTLEPYYLSGKAASLVRKLGEHPTPEFAFRTVFPELVHQRDLARFRAEIRAESIQAELMERFSTKHVFFMDDGDGNFKYTEMRFSRFRDDDVCTAVFGLRNADNEIRAKMERTRQLEDALAQYKQADYDKRRDFLTGLYNRLDLFEMIKDSLSGDARPIQSMFMVDIDNYKRFNDLYGHVAGDECLQAVGNCVKLFGDRMDTRFYRYGGEEILGICYNAQADAAVVAQELLNEIRALKIPHKDSPTGYLTVSIGYTTDNSRYEKMIDKADKAMYKAKNSGKNRVACFEDISIAEILESQNPKLTGEGSDRGQFNGHGEHAVDNIVASYRMNLSGNTCGDGISSYPTLAALCEAGTADAFFESACGLVHPSEQAKFRERFSLPALRSAYDKGVVSLGDEFQLRVYTHHYSCLRFSADLYRVPFSGEVEATVSIIDINYGKRMQQIAERLIENNYEFLCIIDAGSGHMMPFRGTTPGEQAQLGQEELFYDRQGMLIGQEMMPMHDLLILERKASLETVLEQLALSPDYRVIFPAGGASGKKSYKRLRYAYLDESRELIMLAREDVTELISKELDDLTGLYNAEGFHRRVKEWLEQNPGRTYRMIQFDFDGFRNINGIHGYEEGNQLLRGMGRYLLAMNTEDILCGHLSADHFACFCAVDGSPTPEELHERFNTGHPDYLTKYHLSLHVGVYDLCEDDVDSYNMCYRAQLALETVKGDGMRPVAYYAASMLDREKQLQNLLEDFNAAIAQEQFEIFLQPQVDYLSGDYIGAEALVRWVHPTKGIILPSVFIPALERHGLITTLDLCVWEKCCHYLRQWIDQYGDSLVMALSVNISRVDIYTLPLLNIFTELIRKYQLSPERLRLEITEGAFNEDPRKLIETVKELQAAGFSVQMDDFGSGYSSLNTLKDIPVDALKLDMKFLHYNDKDSSRGGNILASVVRMANWLKLPVIAEGIESKAQADYLQSIGCYYMQGYYFSAPVCVSEFEKMMRDKPFATPTRFHDVSLEGMSEFWNSSAQNTLLFNSYIGGAAILEYSNGDAEIVRANPRFFSQLHTTHEQYRDSMLHLLDTFDEENRTVFEDMLRRAIATGEEAQCETKNRPQQAREGPIWINSTVRLIARNNDRYLFYMQTINTTREHIAELQVQEQRKIDTVRSDIIVEQMNAVTFEYYFGDSRLHLRLRGADGRAVDITRVYDGKFGADPLILPEHKARLDQAMESITKPGMEAQKGRLDFVSRFWSGEWQWSRAHYSCIRDENGKPYCIVGQIENIQQEKDAEELQELLLHTAY